MAFRLTADCLDRWISDFDAFNYEFRYYALSFAKAVGYAFDFDGEALKIVHGNWVAQCELWHKTMIMPDSNGLSHTKIIALLLFQLSAIEWLKALREFEIVERNGLKFAGTLEERKELRDNINGGGGIYLAFQFAIMVINFFEAARTDKVGPFEFRMTKNLEHDIMVYLHSRSTDPMAIFLVFESLYARHKKPNGNGNGG